MSEYKIHRWDVIMSGSSNQKVPMIYIKPDLAFLNFIRDNNYAVLCKISGTGTVYDGQMIPGVVAKSADVPSCRPNFFEKTGFYVVTLWANWYGYPVPDSLGTLSLSGLHGKDTGDVSLEDQPDDPENLESELNELNELNEQSEQSGQRKTGESLYQHLQPNAGEQVVRSSVDNSPGPKNSNCSNKTIIIVAIAGGGVLLILAAVLVWCHYAKRGAQRQRATSEASNSSQLSSPASVTTRS
jgi:hypothetical protein